MKWLKRAACAVLAFVAASFACFFTIAPAWFDGRMNRVVKHEPYAIAPRAAELHERLRLADLHSDLLLTNRDPLKRYARGHTDLPRLIEGGYRLQVFSLPTKVPNNVNYDRNESDSDSLTALFVAQRWPRRTWTSLAERALYAANRLDRAAERSHGRLAVIRTKSDLRSALSGDAVASVLALEGAHPLEGDLANLDRLADAGYRVMGLQHFFDNELGGSLHGVSRAGLTEFGREAVKAAEAKGVIIDVAHSSEATVRDALSVATRPLIVSHTGLRGHCPGPRNISDELMEEIAARGGLIGVGFWDAAVCEPTPQSIARAIAYGIELVGREHIALGSDYDGATTVPFDAAEARALTDALVAEGLDDETIALVMGENAIRFFLAQLPD
jgi:microsomal dipeptidase-like Zn-dependent dipeptidase